MFRLEMRGKSGSILAMSEPNSQDHQINDSPDVWKTGDHEFMVRWVTREHGDWFQTVDAYCEHCHRDIRVAIKGPCNKPKFLVEEAKRLALLEHLRTEHPTFKKPRISN
jgi:hypothetical protein